MTHARKVKGYWNTRFITLFYDTDLAIDLLYKDPLKAQIEASISNIESIVISTIKQISSLLQDLQRSYNFYSPKSLSIFHLQYDGTWGMDPSFKQINHYGNQNS